jgi:AcrR family transcriptional regulator
VRQALSQDRILQAAMRLVDKAGVDVLSMRKLAGALRVEAMSLYKHVADKDAVLDGLVDLVVREIGAPLAGADWRTAMRHHAVATRQACRRHRWAAALLESRGANSPIRMGYANAILGLLRTAGFPVPMAYRAFLLIDSYLYGFIMQEATWPNDEREMTQLAAFLTSAQTNYPALAEAMSYVMETPSQNGGIHDREFEYGLDMILDGLQRLRPSS